MNISDIIRIIENEKLTNLFTEKEQMDMYLLVQAEVRAYLSSQQKNNSDGYEDSSYTLKKKR